MNKTNIYYANFDTCEYVNTVPMYLAKMPVLPENASLEPPPTCKEYEIAILDFKTKKWSIRNSPEWAECTNKNDYSKEWFKISEIPNEYTIQARPSETAFWFNGWIELDQYKLIKIQEKKSQAEQEINQGMVFDGTYDVLNIETMQKSGTVTNPVFDCSEADALRLANYKGVAKYWRSWDSKNVKLTPQNMQDLLSQMQLYQEEIFTDTRIKIDKILKATTKVEVDAV